MSGSSHRSGSGTLRRSSARRTLAAALITGRRSMIRTDGLEGCGPWRRCDALREGGVAGACRGSVRLVLPKDCPCGTGEEYGRCCGRFHCGAADPPTAQALMRSRYAAFAVGDADYLFRTWHPRTRPDSVVVDPALSWTGLEIADVVAGSRARRGRRGRLHRALVHGRGTARRSG